MLGDTTVTVPTIVIVLPLTLLVLGLWHVYVWRPFTRWYEPKLTAWLNGLGERRLRRRMREDDDDV